MANNINDAAGVQALLDQLRSSTAWQQTIAAPADADVQPSVQNVRASTDADENRPHHSEASSSTGQKSVAELLSQLQNSSAVRALGDIAPNRTTDYSVEPILLSQPIAAPDPDVAHRIIPPAVPRSDLREASFQQTLPVIAQLSADSSFIAAVRQLREEQAELEQRLWEERQAILKKHEEKVQVARTKAAMIGVSVSKFEADSMTAAFRKELQRFDKERVIPAWDGLVTKQQSTLESLGGTHHVSDRHCC